MTASSAGDEKRSPTTEAAFSNFNQMAEEASKYIRELETWFEDHGRGSKKPWPAHIIASKAKRLEWATKAKEIFERGSRIENGEAA